MAVEARRGCGYRRIGGLYLVADGPGFDCGKLPIPLLPCPLCEHRPSFTRGLQRIIPANVLHAARPCPKEREPGGCRMCPLSQAMKSEQAGMLWVGDRFYSPRKFQEEAAALGVSRRIPQVPKWLEVGKTWIFCAHIHVFDTPCPDCAGGQETPLERAAKGKSNPETCETCEGEGTLWEAGVFFAFQPSRIEKVVGDDTPENELQALRDQGITPVIVPANDPDHQPRKRSDE